jgi:UDP-glucose 4-epimerase
MKVLVTGSSGHLGEALFRTLRDLRHEVVGLDILESPFTTCAGSITDRSCVRRCVSGAQAIFHTATLHKPHVATHTPQEFVDTNIVGTLNLLEEAVTTGVESFVFTSTTSVFGDALMPPAGTPAAWVTEEVRPIPKNIYGVSKSAAEDICSCSTGTRDLHASCSERRGFFQKRTTTRLCGTPMPTTTSS